MEVVTLIITLCNIRVAEVDKYLKHDCIEHYTNCLVVENGRFASEKVEQCKLQYKQTQKKAAK